jgi:hypothetical protein
MKKNRLIYDRVFMAFGSMMKSVDTVRMSDDEFMLYAEEAWKWSVLKVTELVEHLYNGTLPDAQNGTPETSSTPPAQTGQETTVLTVKGFAMHRQGQTKNGHSWTQYKLTDTFDRNYFTFRSGYELGNEYEIDFVWGEKDGKKWRTVNDKTSPRAVKADYDDSDITP